MNLTKRNTARIERAARSLQRAMATAGTDRGIAVIHPDKIALYEVEPAPHEATINASALGNKFEVTTPAEVPTNLVTSRQPGPDAEAAVCTKCKKKQPIDQFPFRPDRPNRRWTQCADCRAAAQRGRYLSVQKKADLAEVGIEFTIADGDAVVGMRCTECDHPLRTGQTVVGETDLRHSHCPRT